MRTPSCRVAWNCLHGYARPSTLDNGPFHQPHAEHGATARDRGPAIKSVVGGSPSGLRPHATAIAPLGATERWLGLCVAAPPVCGGECQGFQLEDSRFSRSCLCAGCVCPGEERPLLFCPKKDAQFLLVRFLSVGLCLGCMFIAIHAIALRRCLMTVCRACRLKLRTGRIRGPVQTPTLPR